MASLTPLVSYPFASTSEQTTCPLWLGLTANSVHEYELKSESMTLITTSGRFDNQLVGSSRAWLQS
jgi:hypothetical protein